MTLVGTVPAAAVSTQTATPEMVDPNETGISTPSTVCDGSVREVVTQAIGNDSAKRPLAIASVCCGDGLPVNTEAELGTVTHPSRSPNQRTVSTTPEDPRTWQEVAASNRERIRSLEHEMERARARLHELQTELAAVRFLGERIADLGQEVKHLSEELTRVARRAIERPSQGAVSVLGQYLALALAIAAFIFAATR